MSSDDGIYILKSKDGYRVAHLQAIENLWWWDDISDYKDEINPSVLKELFQGCKVLKSREEAVGEAIRLYKKSVGDDFYPQIPEYGIKFINGWEDKEFPK